MTFVVDESVDRQIVNCLRTDGYEVFYIAELELGISDDEVLSLANRKGGRVERFVRYLMFSSFFAAFRLMLWELPSFSLASRRIRRSL